MGYPRFTAMIVGSTVVMFGLSTLTLTHSTAHVFYSQTRTWMAVLMGAVMAIIMMSFMWGMYPNKKINAAILIASTAVFAVALWLVRSQEMVFDVHYMKAMIPHHSIAILTSERAHIRDPEVRRLADRIIDAQVREIGEMKALIERLEAQPVAEDARDLPSYRSRGAPSPASR